ncbi:MAG: response regulator [Thermoguttaceae bacterium]
MVALASILLVDRASPFAETTAARLRSDGYQCDVTAGVEDALRLLQGQAYDLLITDVQLDERRSLELVEQAKKLAPGLPTIVVTESPCLKTALHAVELSVAAYLPKHVPYDALREKIQSALARTECHRSLRRLADQLRHCADDLADLRLHHRGHAGTNGITQRVPLATVQALAGCLSELVAIERGSRPEQQVTRICELLQCPVWKVHRNVVQKAVLLLHETLR